MSQRNGRRTPVEKPDVGDIHMAREEGKRKTAATAIRKNQYLQYARHLDCIASL